MKTLTRRSARKGADLDRVRRDAQAYADTQKVRLNILRLTCGAHVMTTRPPSADTTLIEVVEPKRRNKRTQRTMTKSQKEKAR